MFRVRVSKLPRWISDLNLKDVFSKCGKILTVELPLDTKTLRPLGYADIIFADEEAANKALEKNGSTLDGSTIAVNLIVDLVAAS